MSSLFTVALTRLIHNYENIIMLQCGDKGLILSEADFKLNKKQSYITAIFTKEKIREIRDFLNKVLDYE